MYFYNRFVASAFKKKESELFYISDWKKWSEKKRASFVTIISLVERPDLLNTCISISKWSGKL